MKSAFELAMERLEKDAPALNLTDAQRAALAEIENRARAKIAEKRVLLGGEIEKARASGDVLSAEQLEDQLRREIRRIEDEAETKKKKSARAKPPNPPPMPPGGSPPSAGKKWWAGVDSNH